jgi:NCS1 family nucleobase:cation symporter-1
LLCADYYVVKKQRLSITDLYKSQGSIYWYDFGVNWRAFVAFACGFIPSLPGFIQSINSNINVGTGWVVFEFAWMYGTVVTAGVYILLCYLSPHPESTLSVEEWQEKEVHDEGNESLQSDEKGSTRGETGQDISVSNYLA